MKVYIVMEWDNEIVEIFSNKEKAEKFIKDNPRPPGFMLSISEYSVA